MLYLHSITKEIVAFPQKAAEFGFDLLESRKTLERRYRGAAKFAWAEGRIQKIKEEAAKISALLLPLGLASSLFSSLFSPLQFVATIVLPLAVLALLTFLLLEFFPNQPRKIYVLLSSPPNPPPLSDFRM